MVNKMDEIGRRLAPIGHDSTDPQVAGRRSRIGRDIGKRGDYKYGVIFSLILGLMVLSLSLYFIFNEIWSGDDASREVCRQSIQLRSLLPDFNVLDYGVKSFKEEFPLKCKTNVVEIDEGEIERGEAGKIIAESMAECWALFDSGDASAFPPKVYSVGSTCVPCARIHLTDEAKARVGAKGIDIRNALNLKMSQGFSYYSYLMDSGKKFPAFNPGFAREFNLDGEGFRVTDNWWKEKEAIFKNKLTGGVYDGIGIGINEVILPRVFDPTKGDLLISYGIITSAKESPIGYYIPYLFYFQTEDGSPFEEVGKQLVDGQLWHNANVCESWEGIPA